MLSILRSYNHETMKIYCPTAVATVLHIRCSVPRLLLRLPPFNFTIIRSWNYDDLLSHCSSNSPEHKVFCCLLTTPTTPSISLPTPCYWYSVYKWWNVMIIWCTHEELPPKKSLNNWLPKSLRIIMIQMRCDLHQLNDLNN